MVIHEIIAKTCYWNLGEGRGSPKSVRFFKPIIHRIITFQVGSKLSTRPPIGPKPSSLWTFSVMDNSLSTWLKVSTQPFPYHSNKNSRKPLSPPPLPGNNLHIYGHAITRATRHHGECWFRAGWGGFWKVCEETAEVKLLQYIAKAVRTLKHLQRRHMQPLFGLPAFSAHTTLASRDLTAEQF